MHEKRTICEALIAGKWHLISVETLREYDEHGDVLRRCPECKARIKLMKESHDGKKAHFEHYRRNSSCAESVAYGKHDTYGHYTHTYIEATQMDIIASDGYRDLLEFVLSASNQDTASIEKDIEEIISNGSIDSTEKTQLISARIGQGRFRKSLLNYWGKCAVSGVSDPMMLLASHIKPWSKSTDFERLDSFNGLLLTPNLDRAFDQGLISFDAIGSILVSSNLEHPEKLGINNDMKIVLKPEHQQYMEFHRANVFKNTYPYSLGASFSPTMKALPLLLCRPPT